MSAGTTFDVRACTDRKTVTASVECRTTTERVASSGSFGAALRAQPVTLNEPRTSLGHVHPLHTDGSSSVGSRGGARDRPFGPRRARHRRLARARPRRRAHARACGSGRRDRGHPSRVRSLGGDGQLGLSRDGSARAGDGLHGVDGGRDPRHGASRARAQVRRHRPRSGGRDSRKNAHGARVARHPDQQRRHARSRRAVPRPEPRPLGARSPREPDVAGSTAPRRPGRT